MFYIEYDLFADKNYSIWPTSQFYFMFATLRTRYGKNDGIVNQWQKQRINQKQPKIYSKNETCDAYYRKTKCPIEKQNRPKEV